MKKIAAFIILQGCLLFAQSIIWEKAIPLEEFGSYYISDLDVSENGEIYIGIQDNPLKDSKWWYGDSKVLGLDLKGNVILDRNYGTVFDYGFKSLAADSSGVYISGDKYNTSYDPTKANLYSLDKSGNLCDSMIIQSGWAAYGSRKIKSVNENCILHHYFISEGWPDKCYNHYIAECDSMLNIVKIYDYTHEYLPDSIIMIYDLFESGFLPIESSFRDFIKSDSGMLTSGYIGGWASRFQFSFLRFLDNEQNVVWEKYYPYYDSEIFPDSRMMWFDNFCDDKSSSFFLARLWCDSDMDHQLDEAESFLTKIDYATGEIIWIIDYPSNFDLQILNLVDDKFLIRTGIKVAKVQTTEFGLDTIWETDFENTGMIAAVDGGYVSVLSTGSELDVFRYYETTGIEDSTIPSLTELHQNYPNPFNPSTEISYSLQHEAQVTLSVFNTKGELVSSLVNEKMRAGIHSVNFNGVGLNSGIYFYKLEVNGKSVDSKRMLLIK